MPACDADRLDELCHSLGREKAPVLRELLYEFMTEHGVTPPSAEPQQEEQLPMQEEQLPMTG